MSLYFALEKEMKNLGADNEIVKLLMFCGWIREVCLRDVFDVANGNHDQLALPEVCKILSGYIHTIISPHYDTNTGLDLTILWESAQGLKVLVVREISILLRSEWRGSDD